MIRVLLAEDQAIVRAGFHALLDAEDGISVVGAAATGREAVEAAVTLRPDLVLMDIRMPEMDGLEATRRIIGDARLSGTRVLVLTTFELDEYVFGALRAGASGFLLKGGEPTELLNAIRVVAAGESLLTPSVTRRLIEAYVSGPSPAALPSGFEELTAREREVLVLIAAGLSNVEIAGELHLSPLTAKTHVSRILGKLGARDRVQLVVMAYQTRLV
ncbi:MAG TPA: response regulator transcription factor [Solirubrobacter sp.]